MKFLDYPPPPPPQHTQQQQQQQPHPTPTSKNNSYESIVKSFVLHVRVHLVLDIA